MRTSVSGMNAQATRLSVVSENIANSDTTGYKQSQTEFSSLILPTNGGGGYNSGAVEAQVRTAISQQGGLSYTGNDKSPKRLDFAVDGNGFFAVGDGAGGTYLTRAGAFTQQADGTLVNAAGYRLQGYPATATGINNVLNGYAGLVDVNLKTSLLSANPTTQGLLTVPLNKDFVVPGTKGSKAFTVDFDNTVLAVGKGMQFTVKLDGAAAGIDVKVLPASTSSKITAADVVKAINDTGGLSDVASLVNGKIVLTSNSAKTALGSSVEIANTKELTPEIVAAPEKTASVTVPGLSPVSTTTGTAAPTNATFTQLNGFDNTGLTAGHGLRMTVTIDGVAKTINVAAPAAAPGKVLLADIVSAINAGTTGFGATLASTDGGTPPKLVVTSGTSGITGNVSMSNILEVTPAVTAVPSSLGTLPGNPNFGDFAAVTGVAAKRPSDNTSLAPSKNSTVSTSITVYNNSGEAVKLDIYYTKTSDTENTWEVAVFDSRKASTGSSAPFPYGPAGTPPLATANLAFDATKFTLKSVEAVSGSSVPAAGVLSINLAAIGGTSNFNLSLADTTQFSGNTQPLAASVNGNPAEVIKDISVGVDGTITAAFASGTSRILFKVPLAMVNAPDAMTAKAGNVYAAGVESGTVLMGFGGSAGFGNLTAGALEDSTVDMASELTTMIESQRSYTANSKVFQTGSEILDVLVNLKR
ncbi:hypothetical protein ASG43_12835 [Aureimonas sp. Leaf454]|nr:hypothetical protein ASG43_12835 [Aureimonas sp. Leaf454]